MKTSYFTPKLKKFVLETRLLSLDGETPVLEGKTIENLDSKNRLVVFLDDNSTRQTEFKAFFDSYLRNDKLSLCMLASGEDLLALLNNRIVKFGFDPRIALLVLNQDSAKINVKQYSRPIWKFIKQGKIEEFPIFAYFKAFNKSLCQLKNSVHELISQFPNWEDLSAKIREYK